MLQKFESILIQKVKVMRTIILIIAVLISTATFAKKNQGIKVPETLPNKLELKDEHQKFKVTTTHFNGDIFGNFFNKQQVYGEYTRGLDGGKVKWNNVSMRFSTSMDRNEEFPKGISIPYMEDFTYTPKENMVLEEKFETFTEHSAFTKNLIWDMLAIEIFAWNYWDELKLNKAYSTPDLNGKVDLAGQGFFENKDIQITYTGVSEQNGERCAVIDYRTMNNPLEVAYEGIDMKGRSHYWGTIWVSLEDKQIEHAVLYEDVIMEMLLPGQTQETIMNATREISFVKDI